MFDMKWNTITLIFVLTCTFAAPILTRAQILSETSAESDTGGNTAGNGASVAEGSSSASVRVTNLINAKGASTVEVEVETESDGDVRTESLRQRIEARKAVEIRVATSSHGIDVRSEVRVGIGEDDRSNTNTPRVSNTFRAWVDWLLSLRLSEKVLFIPQESSATTAPEKSTEDISGLSTFFRRFVDRLLTFW